MRRLSFLSFLVIPLFVVAQESTTEAGPSSDSSGVAPATGSEVSPQEPPATALPAAPLAEEKKEKKGGEEDNVKKDKESQQPSLHYVSVAVKADMTAPIARVNPGFGAHLDVRYILPWMNPWFTVGVDAAWYRLSGEGTQVDPQIGLYDYSWVIDSVPVTVGAAVEIDKPLQWLVFIGGVGFSTVWARSNGDLFGGNTFAEDVAFGYVVYAGLEFRFLPWGGVTVEYRHSGFFLDFDYPHLNKEVGDIGGAMVLVGYKYTY